MARVLPFLLLTAAAADAGLRQAGNAGGFVKALEFKHRLRVCNAYPFATTLDVYRANEKLNDKKMAYKTCQDFDAPLKAGDKLEFKMGGSSAGTFSVSDLPQNDAVLLLIIHRHDVASTAVNFESHVFANLQNAQVAVIDTYKGPSKSSPRIKDKEDATKNSRSEELVYSSIVAVNPGVYEVELAGEKGNVIDKGELVALNRESYVILRVGVASTTGQRFPQELVIFPASDPKVFESESGAVAKSLAASVVVALASLMW